MIAATPASSKRRPRSSAEISDVLRPALDRDAAVARVDADRDPAGIEPRRLAHEVGVLDRGGADDDARDALFEPAARPSSCRARRRRAAPSSRRRQNALDRLRVHRLAGEGAVEIDDMQIFEALTLERRAPARPDRR